MKKKVSFPVDKGFIVGVFLIYLFAIVYDLYAYLVIKLKNSPCKHDARVEHVQQQLESSVHYVISANFTKPTFWDTQILVSYFPKVRKWKETDSKVPMCIDRPRWQTHVMRIITYKKKCYKIDVNLQAILEVNTEKGFVRVEPRVTMARLIETLCPLGWTIPVVPEFEDLTVGGLINGAGLESASHIYGLFHETCLAYEIVLSDASLVRCSKNENTDLFHAIPWSHGTLGFLVAVEIMIIPCKQFVKLTYIPFYTMDDAINNFISECNKPNPSIFIEEIMFSSDTGVVIKGDMTDRAEENKLNDIRRYYKPAFYKHVETFLKSRQQGVDYVPTKDYYFRHSRAVFWALPVFLPYSNNPMFRYLFGWLMPLHAKGSKLFTPEKKVRFMENHFLVQDVMIPASKLKNLVDFMDNTINIYPLWLCGDRLDKKPGLVYSRCKDDLYVDIGIVGHPQVDDYNPVKTIRKLEEFLRQNNGFKPTYGFNYTTEEEFRQMFDHNLYDRVRIKFNCENAFPDIYTKINRN